MKPAQDGQPYVGMAATFIVGSDCYPGTIVAVTHNKDGIVTKLSAQYDSSSITGGDWPNYQYEYERNPKGDIRHYTLRKNGIFKQKGWALRSPGGRIGLGYRRKYLDPSF